MTDIETEGTKVDNGWRGRDGFIGPIHPGLGRTAGDFIFYRSADWKPLYPCGFSRIVKSPVKLL